MFRNYLKTAWCILIKDKMYSFINIAGLSTGMAVAILIGLWMYDELSFDKNFGNYENIAQVIQNQNNNGQIDTWTNTPYPLAKVIFSTCCCSRTSSKPTTAVVRCSCGWFCRIAITNNQQRVGN